MHTALLLQVKNALLTLFRTHHTAGLHLLIDTFLTYNLSWEWKDAAKIQTTARCLKITEKVPFNIASEASYVYILSGQKLIKNAENGPFWRVFENLKLAVKQCFQTGQF